MKTICLIHTEKIVNRIGGAEKVLVDMANALSKRGFCVHILCYDNEPGNPFYKLNKNVHFHLCVDRLSKLILTAQKFICLPLPVNLRRKNRFILRMNHLSKFFKQKLENINPDVIIAFSPDLIYLLNKILKVHQPVISMLHSDPRFFISHKNFIFYKTLFQPNKDIIQVLLPSFVPLLQNQIPNINIVSIPNYIQRNINFKCANYQSHSIINTSRVSQEKRYELLIEAFSKVANKFPDWTLDLWGPTNVDQQYTDKLKGMINSLGLSNKVIFHGETNDIHSKLSQASIFFFPSAFEGFSLALLEAMSHGLPVVACNDCLSVASILHNNIEGFLTDPSPDALSKALELLMSNENLRRNMGTHSLMLASQFNEDIIWDRWQKLIQSI